MQTHKNNIAAAAAATTTTKDNNKDTIILSPTSTSTDPVPQPRRHTSATTLACAACKYRRRKCTSDCILAPYFPHNRQTQFLNAHRLFGVSNIVKIVRRLTPPERDLAMRTIIFEFDARAADPVGCCCRIMRDLEQRISLAKAELEIVRHHLAIWRAVAAQRRAAQGRDSYAVEDEAVIVDDVDSWGCMNEDFHAHAESASCSFPNDDPHGRKLSIGECTTDMIKPIIDHLVYDDDFREDEFRFDSIGNTTPRKNNGSFITTFKEDNECLSYIQYHQDLKTAATFISLTN